MSLRPPSSPSPSFDNGKNATARQSLGPSNRGTPTLGPGSPRPGGGGNGARPTSELLGNSGMFQTPEAEALDQWFENLQSYEVTLEEMAAASLDVNFKEELSAIEQWFKVLSEAERTAALYSLLQHSTQVQIRFFITVLQQMARSDPMTALLSPAMGGSMQAQMESKLASLKSPGLKSGLPASPTARSFANRQSLILDNASGSNFLSPDSAALASSGASSKEDAAAKLVQQRERFRASNAAHRISAPVLSADGNRWSAGTASQQLSQVAEQNGVKADDAANSTSSSATRPKSTEFSGGGAPRPNVVNGNEVTIPAENSWASMVNTPLIPMFQKQQGGTNAQLNDQGAGGPPGVPRMGDPTVHRRIAKNGGHNGNEGQGGVFRNQAGPNNHNGGPGGWNGMRSPSNRFDDGGPAAGLGMPLGGAGAGFGMGGLGSPSALGMGMGMPPVSPFNMNMNMLSAMGITPETLLAAQMAAAQAQQGAFGGMQPGAGGWMNQPSAGLGSAGRRGPGRSPGLKTPSTSGATPKGEEDVDPALLNDISGWLRSLRLHKYTPNFEGMKWQDMVVMDEAQLEAKGVAALGARRKMLKTFEVVRKKMGIEGGVPAPQ